MGVSVGDHPDLSILALRNILGSGDVSTALGNQRKEASKTERQQYLGVALVMVSDKRNFQAVIHYLYNYFSKGTKSWPKIVSDAYALLNKWKVERSSTGRMLQDFGISFHQREKIVIRVAPKKSEAGPSGSTVATRISHATDANKRGTSPQIAPAKPRATHTSTHSTEINLQRAT